MQCLKKLSEEDVHCTRWLVREEAELTTEQEEHLKVKFSSQTRKFVQKFYLHLYLKSRKSCGRKVG